jgi:hypothetical protein
MPDDWRNLARNARMRVTGNDLEITFPRGRRQVVTVDEAGRQLRLWSIVARQSQVDDDVRQYAWRRNRLSEFVGFRVDARGRLIGESYVPEGVSADEWAFLVHKLAAASDHFQYLLTGRDTE